VLRSCLELENMFLECSRSQYFKQYAGGYREEWNRNQRGDCQDIHGETQLTRVGLKYLCSGVLVFDPTVDRVLRGTSKNNSGDWESKDHDIRTRGC